MSDVRPSLTISYSSDFSLAIQFSSVRGYDLAPPEYRFDFACRVFHSKGEFTYTGRNICFDPQTFQDFAGRLDAIRRGDAESAEFHELGHMVEFSIESRGRKTQAFVKIREYQPNGNQTLLSASFQVDYDLFVNALHSKATDFSAELKGVEPA